MKTGTTRFSIDIKVLKDLKRQRAEKMVRAAAARRPSIAGDRPPHYAPPNITPLTVARGTGPRMPRATVVRDRLIPNRSRSGDLDLQRGPECREKKTRGTGPRTTVQHL